MGIDLGRLNEAAIRARKMIHEDAKHDAHIIKERVRDRNNSKYYSDQPRDSFSAVQSMTGNESSSSHINEDTGDDRLFAAMDAKMKEFKERKDSASQSAVPSFSAKNAAASKLPREILEAFAKEPLTFNEGNDVGVSVMDFMPIAQEEPQRSRGVVNEEVATVQAPQRNVPSGVDYELIKSIVESAVKKYVGAYAKKMLTESKSNDGSILKGIQLKGDKFVFITENGDVYESKLEFKKNINAKKKA